MQSVEAGLVTSLDDFYAKSGYEVIQSYLCIVFDDKRFYSHVVSFPGSKLLEWSNKNYDPPTMFYNGFIWVFSPGPRPDSYRYRI